jgi:hypothetical protein
MILNFKAAPSSPISAIFSPRTCRSRFRIPLPLTIIQILAVDLGTDALGLGAQKPAPDIMKAPRR